MKRHAGQLDILDNSQALHRRHLEAVAFEKALENQIPLLGVGAGDGDSFCTQSPQALHRGGHGRAGGLPCQFTDLLDDFLIAADSLERDDRIASGDDGPGVLVVKLLRPVHQERCRSLELGSHQLLDVEGHGDRDHPSRQKLFELVGSRIVNRRANMADLSAPAVIHEHPPRSRLTVS